MGSPDYARWFKDIRARDIASVGGKNASLGEMYSTLSPQGVQVPNGFALTAGLYRDALTAANAWTRLTALLQGVGGHDVARLASAAAEARSIVHAATGTERIRTLLAETIGGWKTSTEQG
jgi:pyruvate,water dikinase